MRVLKKLIKRKSAKTITTFDFSTLYTKIPHDKLVGVLEELVDFCFQGGTHERISITGSGARWVSKNTRSGICYDRNMIKQSIRYLVNNCFFKLGDKIFRQVIGIPMGLDPAPFMANLFLYHYENKWVRGLKKISLQRARKYSLSFRFIDDLFIINDDGEFERSYKEIYPPELQLNKEHFGDKVSFLDLCITKKDRQLSMNLFDKRDDFPFSIVRMPFSTSNIPSTMFYASIGAEILRISRVNSNIAQFLDSSKILIQRMLKQGAKKHRLTKILKKMYGRHETLQQFGTNAVEFVNSLC